MFGVNCCLISLGYGRRGIGITCENDENNQIGKYRDMKDYDCCFLRMESDQNRPDKSQSGQIRSRTLFHPPFLIQQLSCRMFG